MRFTDAREAGRALAEKLDADAELEGAVVLGVARGGVGVAAEVAHRLRLPLDLVLLQRLLVPRGPDDPLCAANVAGSKFLDAELAARADDPAAPAFKTFLADALAELDAHARACRGDRPTIDLSGKTVLLVDNGVRTGSTLRVAARAALSLNAARIVAAVPVADAEAVAVVRACVAEFICLSTPAPFGHVGLWYANFARLTDEEIRATLEESARI